MFYDFHLLLELNRQLVWPHGRISGSQPLFVTAGAFFASLLTRVCSHFSAVRHNRYNCILRIFCLNQRQLQVDVQTKSRGEIILTESILGFGIGILGGLVGLILGSIRLPTMISVLKMNPSVAVGTNLAASSVMGIFALIGHLLNNEVDFLILVVMGCTALICGYMGGQLNSPLQ